jgi:hypothetical protein
MCWSIARRDGWKLRLARLPALGEHLGRPPVLPVLLRLGEHVRLEAESDMVRPHARFQRSCSTEMAFRQLPVTPAPDVPIYLDCEEGGDASEIPSPH